MERILFSFKGKDGMPPGLQAKFSPYGNMLTRLMAEVYDGPKYKFLNIYFNTQAVYDRYGEENHEHPLKSRGGYFHYNAIIDLDTFLQKPDEEQIRYVWDEAYRIFSTAAQRLNNPALGEAAQHAYEEGLRIDLNPDYRMIKRDIVVDEIPFRAAIWARYRGEKTAGVLTIERGDDMLLEYTLVTVDTALEVFYVIFRAIEQDGRTLIVKGMRDANLPKKILLPDGLDRIRR